MKKVLMLMVLLASFTACSGLKEVKEKHEVQRKELRAKQREEKKELRADGSVKIKEVASENKASMDKLKIKLKKEKELLLIKQLLELSTIKANEYNLMLIQAQELEKELAEM